MNISEEQKEQLVLLIQGAVCAAFLGAAVLRESKDQRKIRKKAAASRIRHEEKLAKEEYRWKKKLMRQQGKQKLRKKRFAQ